MVNPVAVQEEAVRRIVGSTAPDVIVLFGSHARGDATAESDMDLMVIYRDLPREKKRTRAQELYRLLWNLPVPTDIVVANRADIELRSSVVGYVYGVALREGITLYERNI